MENNVIVFPKKISDKKLKKIEFIDVITMMKEELNKENNGEDEERG